MSAHTLHVEALDVLITLEVAGDELASAVRDAWRDALTEVAKDDERHRRTLTVALADGAADGTDVTGADVRDVLHRLSPAVTIAALDARAGELVLLHAAALADPETGAAAVLVAASGTGKTTASIALGKDLVYLSDETAGIDTDGRVARYRKPLSLVGEDHVKAQVAPSDLGLRLDHVDGRVKTVLHLERDPGHTGHPTVEHVHTVDAFALIAPQASALARTEKPLHRLADVFESTGGVKRIKYAEAATLLPLIRVLLSEERS
ncbi:MAG: hypothetical protein ACI379_07650 [Nocardioides sp.]|uniref:hypothetical protein n=1 Tax=Nocardioides sp. TaxID=35761 RepID=UPI003F0E32A1